MTVKLTPRQEAEFLSLMRNAITMILLYGNFGTDEEVHAMVAEYCQYSNPRELLKRLTVDMEVSDD